MKQKVESIHSGLSKNKIPVYNFDALRKIEFKITKSNEIGFTTGTTIEILNTDTFDKLYTKANSSIKDKFQTKKIFFDLVKYGVINHECAHIISEDFFSVQCLKIMNSKILPFLNKVITEKKLNDIPDYLIEDARILMFNEIIKIYRFNSLIEKQEIQNLINSMYLPKVNTKDRNFISTLHNLLIDIYIENDFPKVFSSEEHIDKIRYELKVCRDFIYSSTNPSGNINFLMQVYIDPRYRHDKIYQKHLNSDKFKKFLEIKLYSFNPELLHHTKFNMTDTPTVKDLLDELYEINKIIYSFDDNEYSVKSKVINKLTSLEYSNIIFELSHTLLKDMDSNKKSIQNDIDLIVKNVIEKVTASRDKVKSSNIDKDFKNSILEDYSYFLNKFPNKKIKVKSFIQDLENILKKLSKHNFISSINESKNLLDEAITELSKLDFKSNSLENSNFDIDFPFKPEENDENESNESSDNKSNEKNNDNMNSNSDSSDSLQDKIDSLEAVNKSIDDANKKDNGTDKNIYDTLKDMAHGDDIADKIQDSISEHIENESKNIQNEILSDSFKELEDIDKDKLEDIFNLIKPENINRTIPYLNSSLISRRKQLYLEIVQSPMYHYLKSEIESLKDDLNIKVIKNDMIGKSNDILTKYVNGDSRIYEKYEEDKLNIIIPILIDNSGSTKSRLDNNYSIIDYETVLAYVLYELFSDVEGVDILLSGFNDNSCSIFNTNLDEPEVVKNNLFSLSPSYGTPLYQSMLNLYNILKIEYDSNKKILGFFMSDGDVSPLVDEKAMNHIFKDSYFLHYTSSNKDPYLNAVFEDHDTEVNRYYRINSKDTFYDVMLNIVEDIKERLPEFIKVDDLNFNER